MYILTYIKAHGVATFSKEAFLGVYRASDGSAAWLGSAPFRVDVDVTYRAYVVIVR